MFLPLWIVTLCSSLSLMMHLCLGSFEDRSEELCRYNGHIAGQWIKYNHSTPQSKAFYCCGILDNDYKWNKTLCGHVKGMSPMSFTGINDKPVLAYDRSCNQEKIRNERLNASVVESYVWEPFFCNLIPWDGVKFCELLGNRTILLVGDSTMGQSATTLMSMIAASHGSCASQVTYYRSNFIFFASDGQLSMYDITKKLSPRIVIFTVGAHLEDMGDIYNVWSNLGPIIKSLQTSFPKMKLIWKSSNPADDNCMSMHEPLPNYPRVRSIPVSRWGHHLWRRYDTISRQFARTLEISFMDMSPLYMRGDAHVGHFINEKGVSINDCLHYVTPGPLNLFSNILLNMLHTREI